MIFLVSKIAKLSSFFLAWGKWVTALYFYCAWWMGPFTLSPLLLFFVVGWNGTSYHLWLSFLLIRYHHLLKRKLSYAYSKESKSINYIFLTDVRASCTSSKVTYLMILLLISLPFPNSWGFKLTQYWGKLNILTHLYLSCSTLSGQVVLW